jgi:hypothetical protein
MNDLNDPVVMRISELLNQVGLYHSYSNILGERMIIEDSFDFEKAIRIPGFFDTVSRGTGIFDGSTVLPARRVLLAYVVDIIKRWGATLEKETFGGTVDEAYHLSIGGRNIDFFLMSE